MQTAAEQPQKVADIEEVEEEAAKFFEAICPPAGRCNHDTAERFERDYRGVLHGLGKNRGCLRNVRGCQEQRFHVGLFSVQDGDIP